MAGLADGSAQSGFRGIREKLRRLRRQRHTCEELRIALDAALAHKGPALVEIETDVELI